MNLIKIHKTGQTAACVLFSNFKQMLFHLKLRFFYITFNSFLIFILTLKITSFIGYRKSILVVYDVLLIYTAVLYQCGFRSHAYTVANFRIHYVQCSWIVFKNFQLLDFTCVSLIIHANFLMIFIYLAVIFLYKLCNKLYLLNVENITYIEVIC